MVQCEMCGAETASPRTAKIEGAELQVCDDCVNFGTEIRQQPTGSRTTKYSTETSSKSSTPSSSNRSRGRSRRRRDPFDDLEEIVADYDVRIRTAREAAGLSQAELGQQLNEKASFIRKLEHGESLPSDDIRRKLEHALDIDLVEGTEEEDVSEWSSGSSATGMTLGDVVERKD